MKILTLLGSLRKDSTNGKLLRAAGHFLPDAIWISTDLAALPYFDPDRQYENTPDEVLRFRAEAADSDLVLIATPEYAHSMPGLLKNGLEWLFHEGTSGMPAAVIIGSGQGEQTRVQLLEVLRTMDFTISEDRCHLIEGARAKVGADGAIADRATRDAFESFLLRIAGHELENRD